MQNLFVVMLILIGAAVVLFFALMTLQPGVASGPSSTPGPAPEGVRDVIPHEIEGFVLEDIERAEPVFEGELFSVHATFVPQGDSPFAGNVESLGISIFQLKDPQAAGEIKPLLIMGESSPLALEGVETEFFSNEEAVLAGLIWQEGLRVYYVLVSGAAGASADVLREAALTAARAVLGAGGE